MLAVHYKSVFLNRSETFIRVQLESMPGFEHFAICREFLDNTVSSGIPRHVIPSVDFSIRKLSGYMPLTSIELRRRGASLVHAHFGKDGWTASSFAGCNRSLPLVVSFYGRDASAVLRIPVWQTRFAGLFQAADRILVLSDHMKGMLEAAGCPAEKLSVHSFGVDLPAFPFRKRSLPVSGPVKLLFVGRLVPKKGLETAVRALTMLPGCELEVIGDGPGSATGAALAQELGVSDRVIFSGWHSPDGVAEAMAASHLLLVPSETGPDGDMEGTPTVIFEAMASGLPVIGSNHAGIPEQLGFGACGLIVPERDPSALSAAVRSVAESDRGYGDAAEAARSRVETSYDAARQGMKLERLYEDLIRQRERGR